MSGPSVRLRPDERVRRNALLRGALWRRDPTPAERELFREGMAAARDGRPLHRLASERFRAGWVIGRELAAQPLVFRP